MPSQVSWVEALAVMKVDGPALSTNNVATSILDPTAKITLPANFFDKVGKTLRMTARGRMTTVSSGAAAQTMAVKFGATVVFSGGWNSPTSVALANMTFKLSLDLVCRAVGASANLMGIGEIIYQPLSNAATNVGGPIPDTAPAVGSNFDSTVSQTVDLFATILTANISSMQLHQFILESLN